VTISQRLLFLVAAAGFVVALIVVAYWLHLRSRPVEPALSLSPSSFADLDGWAEDPVGEALSALLRSCQKISGRTPAKLLMLAGSDGDWDKICLAAKDVELGDDAASHAFFERWFRPFVASDRGNRRGLFTGYYEPLLKGSREPHPDYPVALLKRPPSLIEVDLGKFADDLAGRRISGHVVSGRLLPFPTRAEIADGALDDEDLALVWVKDPIAAFFLQIQGSGRVEFEDGDVMQVGYAGQNGHPYFAIGRELIAREALTPETVSLQTIRDWLEAHPSEATDVMNLNRSYVFFQTIEGEGPIGAQGVPLTPGRSLAVDRKFVPLGVPIWLETTKPALADGEKGEPWNRLMIAQDTGGAIRGPVRGDVFWGYGTEAEEIAGRMKSPGRYWILLPITASDEKAAMR